MLINITKEQENLMTRTELNVLDWLNEHEDELANLSISEIAVETYSSPATVSRAIQKCGFSGIAEARYRASNKINYAEDKKVVNKVIHNLSKECEETIDSFDVDTIQRVIHHIKFTNKIYIIARGTTSHVAKYFELQLQLLGYNAYVITDAQLMRSSNKIFKKDDLVIIFTVKNSTPELEIAAKHAKANEATVITCCCISGTSLEKCSDLYISCKQTNISVIDGLVVSNLPLHLISRIIIDYLML